MNEYLSIFISAIVGMALPYFCRLIVYAIRRFKNDGICGKWVFYIWWMKDHAILLDEMSVTIRKGILSEYRTLYKDTYAKYTGFAHVESNQLCVTMTSNDSLFKGTSVHRYNLSTHEKREILYGFWLSSDADKRVSTGGALLSRRKLSSEELTSIRKEHYFINMDVPLIRLTE